MPKLLTVASVAEILGFSQEKVRTLLHLGKLKGVNHSTGKRPRWGVRESAIEEFLNTNSTKRAADKAAPRKAVTSGYRTYY